MCCKRNKIYHIRNEHKKNKLIYPRLERFLKLCFSSKSLALNFSISVYFPVQKGLPKVIDHLLTFHLKFERAL